MTKEEIIEFCEMKAELEAENEDIYEAIIKALEQQPCEDCISREAVDEYITNLLSGYLYDEERTRLEDLTVYIWELPSVTSQQTSTLDKIRAEISCHIIEDDTSGNTPARLRADWAAANKAHLIDIAILDKYKRESEEN